MTHIRPPPANPARFKSSPPGDHGYGVDVHDADRARTGETRFARWDEFEKRDAAEPLWRISAERMKMEREHPVPLPRQVATQTADDLTICGSAILVNDARPSFGA